MSRTATIEQADAGLREAPVVNGWLAMGLAVVIFAGLSVAAAVSSTGFLEADACTHYLYARFAIEEPHYLVNVWGRPLCTGLYAVPAMLAGRLGVQLTSLVLALVCAWVARQMAKEQGHRLPTLALIFTLGQPLVFLHSFSELTELPFAAVAVLAFWAFQRKKLLLMAFLVGLLPLGRPEGFGFILLAAAGLVVYRKWWGLPLLVLPLGLWNHAGWELFGRPHLEELGLVRSWLRWLPDNWPYAADSLYDPGYLLHFVILMPAIVSPIAFPGLILGIWRKLTERDEVAHMLLCRRMTALLPLMILAVHSLLYWLGKMASNGEPRYMLVVAPFWGILCARGWEWLMDLFRIRFAHAIAGVGLLLPILANETYEVVPLKLNLDWARAQTVARWYQRWDEREKYPRILASHPGIYYFLDLSQTDRERSRQWSAETIQKAQPGTLLVWDPIYAQYNADARRTAGREMLEEAGWKRIDVLDRELNEPYRNLPPTHSWLRLSTDLERADWEIYVSPEPAGNLDQ